MPFSQDVNKSDVPRVCVCVCVCEVLAQNTPQIFLYSMFIFSNLLDTLDSDRGPWDLDLSAKMEALDPSRAEILRYL